MFGIHVDCPRTETPSTVVARTLVSGRNTCTANIFLSLGHNCKDLYRTTPLMSDLHGERATPRLSPWVLELDHLDPPLWRLGSLEPTHLPRIFPSVRECTSAAATDRSQALRLTRNEEPERRFASLSTTRDARLERYLRIPAEHKALPRAARPTALLHLRIQSEEQHGPRPLALADAPANAPNHTSLAVARKHSHPDRASPNRTSGE